MDYFTGCRTPAHVKARFRELAQKYHPDHGGDTRTMQTILAELESRLTRFIRTGVDEFEMEHEWRPNVNAEMFGGILAEILAWNLTIEIIGYWIYCFDSYAYHDQLKEKGFWFSKKHKAWIYSGGKKRSYKSPYTTEDVRDMHGSAMVREHEDMEAIA